MLTQPTQAVIVDGVEGAHFSPRPARPGIDPVLHFLIRVAWVKNRCVNGADISGRKGADRFLAASLIGIGDELTLCVIMAVSGSREQQPFVDRRVPCAMRSVADMGR